MLGVILLFVPSLLGICVTLVFQVNDFVNLKWRNCV